MSLVDFVELSKASGVRSLARSPGYVLARFSCSTMAASNTGAVPESMVACLRRRPWQLHFLCLHRNLARPSISLTTCSQTREGWSSWCRPCIAQNPDDSHSVVIFRKGVTLQPSH